MVENLHSINKKQKTRDAPASTKVLLTLRLAVDILFTKTSAVLSAVLIKEMQWNST